MKKRVKRFLGTIGTVFDTYLENELNKANSKCEELQDVIDEVTRKEFV